MTPRTWWTGLTIVATACSAARAAEPSVQPDKENVVASRLEGTWEVDAELTKRLGGVDSGFRRFRSDAAVAGRIPAKFGKFFDGRRIYLAGTLTLRNVEHPFVLIEHRGNPHVVYFRERNGDPLGDAESFNVMLAPAKETSADLLFVGGDFNSQPFSAFRRAKPTE